MSTNDTSVKKKKGTDLSNLPSELTERGREIWLAGLGALSRIEEEGDKVFKTLVDRGRDYESKRRKQIDDAASTIKNRQDALTSDVSKRIDDATKTVEDVVNRTVNSTLGRIGVPTRHEVRGLSDKVSVLSRKLDALGSMLETQEQDAVGEVVYHVSPHDEGWAVIREGAERATKLFGTKKEAVSAGRDIAKNHIPSQLVVHKQDRSVQESFTYEEEEEDA
jgi:poly(hydroxyalkanoate) granule-associated protein